ncbi:unnamed protein product, partial [Echinostoma caproni]|uniref:Tyrosine-protein phosphatase domain-containing protein n=1 Tax=Echinostoma caproni TaxID=27848 RepID=A0A183ADE0_9TREM
KDFLQTWIYSSPNEAQQPPTFHGGIEIPNESKCDRYWPIHGSCQYGRIKVTHMETTELACYVLRKFLVHCVNQLALSNNATAYGLHKRSIHYAIPHFTVQTNESTRELL